MVQIQIRGFAYGRLRGRGDIWEWGNGEDEDRVMGELGDVLRPTIKTTKSTTEVKENYWWGGRGGQVQVTAAVKLREHTRVHESTGLRIRGKVVNNGDRRQRNFESAHTWLHFHISLGPLSLFPSSPKAVSHRHLLGNAAPLNSLPFPSASTSVLFAITVITFLAGGRIPSLPEALSISGDYPPRNHRRFILTPGRSGSGSGEEWKGRTDVRVKGVE
ncbi:hypothetical protein FPQ18DRAFT_56587 [Pyronema domesticum]|nr:hypothetical protein FPQ18DRAFT_56587 [Pyronema domesticum]